mgnify:CR=1 FL=1
MIRLASNNDGTANFQDIARFMPGGDMMDFENQTGGLPWPQPFMPSHPALNLMAGLAWNIDTFTGKGVLPVRRLRVPTLSAKPPTNRLQYLQP